MELSKDEATRMIPQCAGIRVKRTFEFITGALYEKVLSREDVLKLIDGATVLQTSEPNATRDGYGLFLVVNDLSVFVATQSGF